MTSLRRRQTCRCEVSQQPPSGGIKHYLAGRAGGATKGITTAARRNQTLPCLSCRRHDKRHNNRRQAELKQYLTPVELSAQRQAQQPAHPGFRSDIAPLSASFASEKPGECTYVLDPGGERRKARGSKRDRSVIYPILCGGLRAYKAGR